MNTENFFTLNRHAMIALAVTAAFPATSIAAAGRVEFAIGGATAISADGAARQLAKGADINSGDTIKTTDGRVQVRFTDGGYMSFQPNTEFKIENYNYDGKQDGSEKGFFRLVEGGLRAITGIVGRNNRPAYRVATPVATIGIRGSEYVTEFRPSDNKLRIRVIGGSLYIENEHGDLILFKGQSAEAGEDEKPGYSEEESGVLAKGPDGGEPDKGQNQSEEEQDLAEVFTVNEQYTEEGTSCALTDSCGGENQLASVIADYAAQTAKGTYLLNVDTSSSIAGLNNGKFENGSLEIYFGDNTVFNNFEISAEDSGGSQYFESFSGSGQITSAGGLSVNSPTNYGSLCSGSCSFNGTGMLSGPAAENASINYSISGISSAFGSSTVTGTGQYNAVVIQADGGEGAVLYGGIPH